MQIKHTINGKDYVMLEYLVLTIDSSKKYSDLFEKYGCIIQGVRDLKLNSFRNSFVILNVLVPEENFHDLITEYQAIDKSESERKEKQSPLLDKQTMDYFVKEVSFAIIISVIAFTILFIHAKYTR